MENKQYVPTKEQTDKIAQLATNGYIWDQNLSMSYAAVVLKRDKDIWVFGFDESISHNPACISITV